MAGKGAPEGNQYAAKDGEGLTVSFYLSALDVACIHRLLRDHGIDLSDKKKAETQVRKFARRYAKNGIYSQIKAYMDAEIL